MKLKTFVINLAVFMKKHPETADFDVVTSKDEEGNGFNPVLYGPSIGYFDPHDKDFYSDESPNAVCVN